MVIVVWFAGTGCMDGKSGSIWDDFLERTRMSQIPMCQINRNTSVVEAINVFLCSCA
jgi:hypothetical protein